MSDKIKILIFGMSSNYGGIENYIINCCRFLDRDKYSIDFINAGNTQLAFEKELIGYGCKIYHIPCGFRNYFTIKKELNKIIDQNQYNYIHFHLLNYCGFVPVIAALRNKNIKVILHSHTTSYSGNNDIKEIILHNLGMLLINNKKAIRLACSNAAGRWLFKNNPFIIMKNGIDIKRFVFNIDNRNKVRNKYHIDTSCILIGNVTNFSYPKNTLYLLEVFLNMVKLNSNYKLMIIGDIKKANKEREFVINNNLSDNVIFTGLLNDTYEIYSGLDFYICPSIVEGFNISLMEAVSNGLQCFVSHRIIDNIYPRKIKYHIFNVDQKPSDVSNIIHNIISSNRSDRSDCCILDDYDVVKCIKELGVLYEKERN